MMQPSPRPTTEVRDVILDSMDRMFDQLANRLDGLTNDEYLWEPVTTMWTVRTIGQTTAVDGAGIRDLDPAPATTIAWRLWHVAMDCLDDYTRRFHGDPSDAPAEWTLEAGVAIETLRQKWSSYRGEIASRDWWDQLGRDWGPWANHSVADMAMHASNELVHHGAEIGLLRDLYRASEAGGHLS
ncbi:MAG: DinB family protein [bacterium]|nr:DinB family protein [bacterium]